MRILIIPSVNMQSGTGIRLRGIANALKEKGHDVRIAMNKKEKFFYPADIIFASKTLPGSCVPALYRKIMGQKIVLDIDDLEWDYWRNSPLKYIFKMSDKFFARISNMITTHTENLEKYIEDAIGEKKEKIVFLPQGIDFDMFRKIRWNPTGRKKIVYAAHLGIAAQDLDIIFDVFRKISKKEDCILQVIGDGTHRKYFENLADEIGIGDRVEFLGYVKHKDIPEIFSQANVAINYMRDTLANKYRSSLKVREYLAIGIPTVCNLIGDTSLFSDYVYGFRTGDFDSFEKQLLKALKNPDKKKSQEGRKFIEKNWDWSKVIGEFENAIAG